MSSNEDLLLRALAVIESAYACREWLLQCRSEETDRVLEDLVAELGPQFKESFGERHA